MSQAGHGEQVVNVTPDHSYELNELALKQVLLKPEIKDLPVVVVSVAGAYRTGKSFLLNFFLRYLTSSPEARVDGSWLGENSEPLVGFKWRGGIKRTTTGILMWSDPFVMTRAGGDKVAVILIDTQGTFDSKSTVRDNTTIFAISTLLSSIQIYNISLNIQEDDLQNLQLFTEYGKLVKTQSAKPFQVLEFLVRDWQFEEDYAFGTVGGEQLLEEKLQITPDLPNEMKELRKHLRSSFDHLSCFLMPHPGFKVLSSKYKGNISDIDINFRTKLVELVNSLFGPEKLLPKKINGEQVKAGDLFNYFKSYMALFTSKDIPNPTSIMKATVEAGFLSAVGEARDVYEKGMDSECGPSQLSVPAEEVPILHKLYLNKACDFFVQKKKMGSQEDANKYLEKLNTELQKRLEQFEQSNLSKIQGAISKAKEEYNTTVNGISGSNPLCVHPADLQGVHERAVQAATKYYDASRRAPKNKEDKERTIFIQSFEGNFSALRQENERNNNTLISKLLLDYNTNIQSKAGLDPPLPQSEFKLEHEKELENQLEAFDSKRNIKSRYVEDVFKFKLTKSINESYTTMKLLNESVNAKAIRPAVDVYKTYLNEVWNPSSDKCLHSLQLQREHENGTCRALVTFRPRKTCDSGYDTNDNDESLLKTLIDQHYNSIKSVNDSANDAAATAAYNKYKAEMYNKCGFSGWWIVSLGIVYAVNKSRRGDYHNESKTEAYKVFDGKRHPTNGSYPSDPYRDNLGSLMEKFYEKEYK